MIVEPRLAVLARQLLRQNASFTISSQFSTTAAASNSRKLHYRMLVVGGGSGGAAISAQVARKLGLGHVCVLEPSNMHYYQPGFTMVGGGWKKYEDTRKPTSDVLHHWVQWVQDSAAQFKPEESVVITQRGTEIHYDIMVVAMGVQLRYDLIKGLPEAFDTPYVCSNYHREYVKKTYPAIQNFKKGGNAIFTHPNTPIKCPGATQKVCYIAEENLRLQGKNPNCQFNTALPVIFGVKKYADALWKVADKRGIKVNLRHNLVEVRADKREAVFDVSGEDGKVAKQETFPYDLLHVGAPCSAPEALRASIGTPFVDANGFLAVHKHTLQHDVYKNVFGIGDCLNTPNSKTVAAVAAQVGTLHKTLDAYVTNGTPPRTYDGYASCPLITGKRKCIMAEFDYDLQPKETFPINQAKERVSMFYMKSWFMPRLYWKLFVKGRWEGPDHFHRIITLGLASKPQL